MAELFTHVLVGFILATVASWRWEWITTPMVTVAMVGAALPDLKRVDLVVPVETVEAVVGLSFSWTPLHRVGGTAVLIAVGAFLVPKRLRRGVALLLVIGATSHYLLDFALYTPSGWSNTMLWPLWDALVPVGGVYLSSDQWPVVVTAVIAGGVWIIDQKLDSSSDSEPGDSLR